MMGAAQTAPLRPQPLIWPLALWIKLGNVRVAHYSSLQLWDACAEITVGWKSRHFELIMSRSDSGCFALRPVLYPRLTQCSTFSYIFNPVEQSYILHCIV